MIWVYSFKVNNLIPDLAPDPGSRIHFLFSSLYQHPPALILIRQRIELQNRLL